jgi:hypothetical protein
MTLAEAQTLLTAAQAALSNALAARSASKDGNAITTHELTALRDTVTRYQRAVIELTAKASGVSTVTIGTWR